MRRQSRILNHWYIAMLLALSGQIACSQELSLSNAYQLALKNDRTLQIARLNNAIAVEKIPQARAGLLPTISLVGNYNQQKGDAAFGNGPQESRKSTSQTAGLQLSQPLLHLDRWTSLSQAQLQQELAQLQYLQVQQELLLRLTQAYIDVLNADAALQTAQSQVEALHTENDWMQRHAQIGLVLAVEAQDIKAKLDAAQAQQLRAQVDLESRRQSLRLIVRDRFTNLMPPSHHQSAVKAESLAYYRDAAQQGHLAIQLAKIQQLIAQKELEKTQYQRWPTLDLSVAYRLSDTEGSLTSPVADFVSKSKYLEAGLQLQVPLYGNGLHAKVKEAALGVEKALEQLLLTQNQTEVGVEQAYAGVMHADRHLAALDAAYVSAQDFVRLSQDNFKNGQVALHQVKQSVARVFAAQQERLKVQTQYFIDRLKLQQLIGPMMIKENSIAPLDLY